MSTFLMVVGGVVVLCIAVAFAAGMVCLAAELGRRRDERWRWSVRSECRTELGRSMVNDAHWFGENRAVSEVVKLYGHALLSGIEPDVSRIRDEWRSRVPEVTR
jgi:hypothetical protein